MSNIDKQALREIAAAAVGAHERLSVMPPDDIFDISLAEGTQLDADITALNALNSAANPATVLALLDELEKMQAQSSKWCEAFHKAVYVGARYEERIAELEGNEVREVGNQFLVVRHPGKTPVIKHCTGDLEEFLRKLIEQDPLVTIDIITHRYYGIGGQWVQDAVEYLHMMSDAGIRIKGE
ncbi:TPA: ead/Ea22-like family protein [Escherichia coli]|uniref:ead/Ea22-like family protein n=1 Tax=Escherichia coli TaxID=562 RepID=UPI000DF97F2A|nr:ead/Ea22-like family protein [Escherichia coli]STI30020.1 ea22 [Escherichia coli]HAI2340363.1 ead/Ea22-like family protein [Escherichia coli]HCB2355483.1 ead/Ea22-like family protein [Escherichia coli]HDW2389320.1 ead/Ea22-like family protein [Escherichia coli]